MDSEFTKEDFLASWYKRYTRSTPNHGSLKIGDVTEDFWNDVEQSSNMRREVDKYKIKDADLVAFLKDKVGKKVQEATVTEASLQAVLKSSFVPTKNTIGKVLADAGVTNVQLPDALKILDMKASDTAMMLDGTKIPAQFKTVIGSSRRLSDALDDSIRVFRAIGGAKTLVINKYAYSTSKQISDLVESKLTFKAFLTDLNENA